MGHFKPRTAAQKAAYSRSLFDEMPLLEDDFDEEMDFSDEHWTALQLTGQFSTHYNA